MIYIFIVFILLIFVYCYDVLKFQSGKIFCLALSFIILTILVGVRYRLGGDALSYESIYDFMPSIRDIREDGLYPFDYLVIYQPLWILLNACSVSISRDFLAFQLIHSVIINTLLFVYILKNSKKQFTVLFFLFVTHYYFYFVIEIEREVLAIGIFLLNINNLQKKKWISYYLLCVLSFMFHLSAIILFFIPLFKKINLTFKQVVIVLLLLTPFIFFKQSLISLLKPFFFLEFLQDKLDTYSEFGFSVAGIILNYLLRVIFLMPLLFYNNIYKKYSDYQWMFHLMAILSVLSLSLVGIERFLNYFIIPYIVIFIDFIYYNKFEDHKKYISIIVIVCTLVNLLSGIPRRLLSTNKKGTPYFYLFYPYTSIFDKKIIYEREKFMEENWD